MAYTYELRRRGQARIYDLQPKPRDEIKTLIKRAHSHKATLDDVLRLNYALINLPPDEAQARINPWLMLYDKIIQELKRRKMNLIKYHRFLIAWGVYLKFYHVTKTRRLEFFKAAGQLWYMKPWLRLPRELAPDFDAISAYSGLINSVGTEDGLWGFVPVDATRKAYIHAFTFRSYESILELIDADDNAHQVLSDYLAKPRRRYRSKLKPANPLFEAEILELRNHWRYETSHRLNLKIK